jgi:superfamily II DNA or RNA helicase
MGPMSALRDYQVLARQAMDAFYARGGMSGGVALPTGTGKTRIMVAQADDEAQDDSDPRRVAVIVDRDILVEQTEKTLRKFLPGNISIGVVKARRNELGARVLVISVHTMRSAKRLAQLPPIKLAIVDEAHMSVSPTYKRLFEHIGANQPGGARLAGYSATWTRSDGTGLGDIWQEIVFKRTIRWAIDSGYLVRPRAIQLGEGVDLTDVRTKGKNGDYRESDLGRAVMLEELRDNMVEGVLKHGMGRPGVLFAPTVESAEYFGEGLRAAGIPTEGVYGELLTGERKARHERHDSGETSILTTCTALAVGWDFPPASLGILLRPIRHEGLFVQMAGRLLRTSPGKTDALLLDCVRATDSVMLRNAIDLGKSVHRDTPELEEVPPTEPVTRERIVVRRKGSYEVEIVSGASVPWLRGPSDIPFVMIGQSGLVFIVEDVDGFHVAWHRGGYAPDGNPLGKFVESRLDRDSAMESASEFAEGLLQGGAYSNSDSRGVSNATRELERRRVLGYFARWSAARLQTSSLALASAR